MALQTFHWMKKHSQYRQIVLYSYWLQIPAYAAVRFNQIHKNRHFSISRTHGFDLYLERSLTGYRPFHQQLYQKLEEIASISSHGKQYLEDKYGNHNKVSIHRLGAVDQQCRNPDSMREVLEIVTCSRTVPLKRLDRLVDTLALIHDKQIHWTHLGGVEAQKSLENMQKRNYPLIFLLLFLIPFLIPRYTIITKNILSMYSSMSVRQRAFLWQLWRR